MTDTVTTAYLSILLNEDGVASTKDHARPSNPTVTSESGSFEIISTSNANASPG